MRYLHAGPGAGCDFAQNLVQIAIWQAAGRPGISDFEGILANFLLYRVYFVEISHAPSYRVNIDILEHN